MSLYYNDDQKLSMGQLSLDSLADHYQTPLIVYDQEEIEATIHKYQEGFRQGLDLSDQAKADDFYSISYASKAFSNVYLLRLMADWGLDLDVVSYGELYLALKAGFPADRIHFHGNNKSLEEIKFALQAGIGHFVADSFEEIDRINDLAQDEVDVMVRLNPGIAVQTHAYIQTGQEDSKFGFSLREGLAKQAIDKVIACPKLNFIGLHFHLGSQVQDPSVMLETAQLVLDWAHDQEIPVQFLNMGGGFSIQYQEEDVAFDVQPGIAKLAGAIMDYCQEKDYQLPKLGIEPGRSLVGHTAVTLYEVGTIKQVPGYPSYVSIDGGMSDHIRTALYGAEYTILPTTKAPSNSSWKPKQVVGKLCESGDIIGKNKPLPQSLQVGDRLAVLATGAYHYSMSSNYNLMLKPAVVFVKGKDHKLVTKRQGIDQVLQNEVFD